MTLRNTSEAAVLAAQVKTALRVTEFAHTRLLVSIKSESIFGTDVLFHVKVGSAFHALGASVEVASVAEALAFGRMAEAGRLAGAAPREKLVALT